MPVCLRFQLADWRSGDLLDLEALDIFDFCRSATVGIWEARILNASGRVAGIETVVETNSGIAIVELSFNRVEDAIGTRKHFPTRFEGDERIANFPTKK